LVRNRFNSIPDHRTAVGAGGTFKDAFVVVDEEARRDKDLGQALFHLVELDRTSDGVGGAAAKLSLVINWRTLPAQIDSRRQSTEHCHRRGVKEIAVIRQIRDPAKTFSRSFASPGSRCFARLRVTSHATKLTNRETGCRERASASLFSAEANAGGRRIES
jgi:hypothetical protein